MVYEGEFVGPNVFLAEFAMGTFERGFPFAFTTENCHEGGQAGDSELESQLTAAWPYERVLHGRLGATPGFADQDDLHPRCSQTR